jgi:hypothetical protein
MVVCFFNCLFIEFLWFCYQRWFCKIGSKIFEKLVSYPRIRNLQFFKLCIYILMTWTGFTRASILLSLFSFIEVSLTSHWICRHRLQITVNLFECFPYLFQGRSLAIKLFSHLHSDRPTNFKQVIFLIWIVILNQHFKICRFMSRMIRNKALLSCRIRNCAFSGSSLILYVA